MSGLERRPLVDLLVQAPFASAEHDGEMFDQYDQASFASGVPSIVQRAQRARRARIVQPDDVLCSRSLDAPRRAWVVGAKRGRAQVATDDWLVLRATGFDPAYLRHLLVSNDFRLRCEHAANRRGARTLRANDVEGIDIPALSVADQHRIGLVLEQAAGLRGKRIAVTSKVAMLPQAILNDIESEASRCSWPQVRLRDVLVHVDGTQNDRDPEQGYLVDAEGSTRSGVPVPPAQASRSIAETMPSRAVVEGDVVISLSQRAGNIIAAVAYPGDDARVAHDALLHLRTDPARLNPEYACALLTRSPFCAQLASQRTRRPARVLALQHALADARIALPPLAVQARYAEVVLAARALTRKLSTSARQLDDLLSVLRDRAFRGELRVS